MEKNRRIIKFRAKDNVDNEWYYGDLLQAIDNDTTERYFIITDNYSSKATNIELNMCQSPEVLPETFGQFTGLYDKNKVPIYEGDILNFDDEYWVVSFEYGKFIGTFDNTIYDIFEISHYEVIGNIYDNPNLLGA